MNPVLQMRKEVVTYDLFKSGLECLTTAFWGGGQKCNNSKQQGALNMGVHGGDRTGYWWTVGSRHGDPLWDTEPHHSRLWSAVDLQWAGDSKPGSIGRGWLLTECRMWAVGKDRTLGSLAAA